MKHLLRRIPKLKKEIQSIKGVNLPGVKIWNFGKASKNDFERFNNEIDWALPKAMREFYETFGGWEFEWMYIDPNDSARTVTASSIVQSLDVMLDGLRKDTDSPNKGERHKNILWNEFSSKEVVKELESYLIFDDLGNSQFVLIKFLENEQKLGLFLYSYPDKISRIRLDFETYVETALEARCIHLWQEHFTDQSKLKTNYPDYFIEKLGNLFPDSTLLDLFKKEKSRSSDSFPTFISKDKLSKNSYPNRFDEMVDLIKKRVGSWKVKYKRKPGCSVTALRKASSAIGKELPKSLVDFYSAMNGFELRWEYKIPPGEFENLRFGDTIACDCRMLSLEQVFGGIKFPPKYDWSAYQFDDLLPVYQNSKKDKIRQAFKFFHISEYGSCAVNFNLSNETGDPIIYLLDDGDLVSLKIGFSEYLESLLRSFGINHWQRYLDTFQQDDYVEYPPVKEYINLLFQ